MSSKNRGPKAGTRWFRPNSHGHGFVVPQTAETRHVIDRTLGGDVIFVRGRLTRSARMNSYLQSRCTLSEWFEWSLDAKQVKP